VVGADGAKEMVMKWNRVGLIAAGALVAGLASSAALAGGGYHGHGGGYYGHGGGYYRGGYYGHGGYWGRGYPGVGFGIYLGGPAWWGPGYYYPQPFYAYPPAVVTVPASPPVYIERGEAQSVPAPDQGSQNWWYYCANPSGYYPYVKQCPGGWQRVPPQPPPG
jgi:hypothetical protein